MLSNYFKLDNYSIIDMFNEGYCLEYYNILKEIYPYNVMVLEKDKEHCASLINGKVYDVTGLRNKNLFVRASKEDMDYVNSFYNHFSDADKINIKKRIKML